MNRKKRIVLAILLDLGFLSFLFFAPVIYFSYPRGAECIPEYINVCEHGYYESITLATASGYGTRLLGNTLLLWFNGNEALAIDL